MIISNRQFSSWFCLVLFLVAASFGAFTGGLWAILGIGGAVILYFSRAIADRRFPEPSMDFLVIIVVLLGGIALFNSHSIASAVSWQIWLQLASIFVPLVLWTCPSVQASMHHAGFIKYVAPAAIIGATALGIELGAGAPLLKWIKGSQASLTEYNRGLSYLVLLSFPIMAGITSQTEGGLTERWKKGLLLGALGGALLFAASLTESRAAKLALIAGLAVTLCASFWPVMLARCLKALPFLLLGWPFMAQGVFRTHYEWLKHLPDSWHARMEIWDYMSYRILERPWLGWGLGTSHLLPFHDPDGAFYIFTVIPASHPHNMITELWVELGLPGLFVGVWFVMTVLMRALRVKPEHRPFALGAWMASLCLSLVAYDFWTDSLMAAFAMTGLAFALIDPKSRPSYPWK